MTFEALLKFEYGDPFGKAVQQQKEASMRVWEVAKQVENVPCSSENKSIVPLLSREDLFVEELHIDFIFGDE